jgi:hypothetical protein
MRGVVLSNHTINQFKRSSHDGLPSRCGRGYVAGERSLDLVAIGTCNTAATLQLVEALASTLPESRTHARPIDAVLAVALDERDMPQSRTAVAVHTLACDQNSSAA